MPREVKGPGHGAGRPVTLFVMKVDTADFRHCSVVLKKMEIKYFVGVLVYKAARSQMTLSLQ